LIFLEEVLRNINNLKETALNQSIATTKRYIEINDDILRNVVELVWD